MEGTGNHDFGVPGARARPTRAEALARLGAITVSGAIEDLEFTLTDRPMESASTMTVDMSRIRDLTPATIGALLWISRCARARGIMFELRNTSPRIVEQLQRVGLTSPSGRRAGSVRS